MADRNLDKADKAIPLHGIHTHPPNVKYFVNRPVSWFFINCEMIKARKKVLTELGFKIWQKKVTVLRGTVKAGCAKGQ